MWNCVESLLEIQIKSAVAVSLVNKLRPMYHNQKKLGDTRIIASKAV